MATFLLVVSFAGLAGAAWLIRKGQRRTFAWITAFVCGVVILLSGAHLIESNRQQQGRVFTPEERTSLQQRSDPGDYETLARDPEKYKGKLVKFYGKVIQVIESGRRVDLRIDVTRGEYNLWKNTVYVTYWRQSETESRVLEGDVVWFFGEFRGLVSYKSVIGAPITLPLVAAVGIER